MIGQSPHSTHRATRIGIRLTLALVALSLALTGCSSLNIFKPSQSKAQRTAAEKLGRLSLAATEEVMAADPNATKGPVTLPAARQNTDWPQAGGLANNAPGHVAGPSALKISWSQSVGAGSSTQRQLFAPPIIAEGKLFILDSEHVLRAFDLSSREEVWKTRFRSTLKRDTYAFGGGIAYDNGQIFVLTGYGGVYSVSAASGQEKWNKIFEAPFQSAPTLANGRLFAITNDSEILALNAETGASIWTSRAIAESARILSASSPAVSDELVLAPFPSGELISLFPANGRRLWVDALTRSGKFTPLSAINDIAGRPVITPGIALAASQSGVIAAIELRTGDRKWERASGSIQTPAVAGDYVFVVSIDSQLVCFDRTSGSIYWTQQLPRFHNEKSRKGRISWTGPLIAGGRLIMASTQGKVIAVSPLDGAILDTISVKEPVFITPIAANGHIYILNEKARLFVVE